MTKIAEGQVGMFEEPVEEPEVAIEAEATSPIERAKQRIDLTITYHLESGRAPKRSQILSMLRELSEDLGRLAA